MKLSCHLVTKHSLSLSKLIIESKTSFTKVVHYDMLFENVSEKGKVNPTPEGVRILWVGGGGASEAPPKKTMMEWAETP